MMNFLSNATNDGIVKMPKHHQIAMEDNEVDANLQRNTNEVALRFLLLFLWLFEWHETMAGLNKWMGVKYCHRKNKTQRRFNWKWAFSKWDKQIT